MAKRVALSTLNASTLDILNVIRQNASYEYQQQVPVVTKETDIPHVGEILYGTPALANQFINALVNRIALYRIKSATFNNPYERLKKGYLEFGETVEEVFINLVKPLEFSAEKAEAREHKRYMPDVKSVFHVMNWRVLYPVTIQDDDLKMAFLSIDGVREMIEKIVDAIYTSANYDEYLLFKYLLIKAISHGHIKPEGIDVSNDSNAAVAFRGTSNMFTFLRREYNEEGVLNSTPKANQSIFMDAKYNAHFDVNVLSSAFNMDKAEFSGRLTLIDDWTSFDNERFEIIRENSDGLEEVTAAELALMNDVVAVLIDDDWFQIYDNENKMTEQYTASGLYWNYFYHVWKTISYSPFHNAVVFIKNSAVPEVPNNLTFTVASKDESEEGQVTLVLMLNDSAVSFAPTSDHHDQTEDATQKGVAVQTYGGYIFPATQTSISAQVTIQGKAYTGTVAKTAAVGTEITFTEAD